MAERLPRLYRAVLDAVAELERHGRRRDAAAIRSEATTAYSKAWNLAAERRLASLRIRATRIIEARRPTRVVKVLEPLPRAVDLEHTTA